MIRATIANTVNHVSAAKEVLINEPLAASHRAIGVIAKEITCSPCMIMLSVIISHTDNFIGRMWCRLNRHFPDMWNTRP